MFRKTRLKIVTAIMGASVLLLAGMLLIIYMASYRDASLRNQEMLERYAEFYAENGNPNQAGPELPVDTGDWKQREGEPPERESGELQNPGSLFELSTFYSVCFDKDFEAVSIDNNDSNIYSEEDIAGLAKLILETGKESGHYESFSYLVCEADGNTLVVFMDNTVEDENFTVIRRYTLFFGSITLAIIFLLSWFLSKRIIRPLEENARSQKQFISDAGHELKTPISVIGTNADLLAREIGENRWLGNIQHETLRMASLTGQLMKLVRAEDVILDMERVDFGRIIMGECLSFEAVAFEKGLKLNCQEVQENIFVYGSRGQLGQLAAILLDNAVEHSTGSGSINVRITNAGGRTLFSVSNEGEAIGEEQRRHLFDRFYRGDFARTGGEEHYGLGLAIAKAIVTSHGGELRVDCEGGRVIFTAAFKKCNDSGRLAHRPQRR